MKQKDFIANFLSILNYVRSADAIALDVIFSGDFSTLEGDKTALKNSNFHWLLQYIS
jgi:hypothetical protein